MPEPLTNIKVELAGTDSNAFAIMGTIREALMKGGRKDLIGSFVKEATSGDYENLLRVCCKYVDVQEP